MSDKKDKTTRDQALRVARMLGCQGAHETDAGWMPCASLEEYEGIKKGEEEYLKARASKKKTPSPKMVQRTKRLETKSGAYYENRADALSISKIRGCGGVRTVMLAGKRYYTPCDHKPRNGWENLNEKPITGIATLPGGGLVTGSFSGKSLGRPIGGVAEFDGDGDGLVTGPDGEDNIPAPKIPKKLFHGSTVKLNVGDYLLPPSETGVKPRAHPDIDAVEFNNTNYVYLTSKLEDAQGYGSDVVKPGQKIYIYEVEPSADVEEDPENEIFGVEGGFRSRKAKIKKIVATLTSNTEGSMDEKGFVNFVSRSTDPDTFSNPESARIRARNIGCIGIRRYTARDGKLVWLPCTNVSDYNRVTGIRGDNSPRNNPRRPRNNPRRPRNNPRRRGSGFSKKDDQSLIAQTSLMSFKGVPKPKKKPPTVTSTDINNLAVMVRKNNAKAKTSAKTNLRDLKVVFVRGLADGGREEANKRISKFLSLLNSDKPKDVKYSEDNDLLPIDHPWKNRKTAKKWAGFDEGEYGIKYAGGCCPKAVKRHRAK